MALAGGNALPADGNAPPAGGNAATAGGNALHAGGDARLADGDGHEKAETGSGAALPTVPQGPKTSAGNS